MSAIRQRISEYGLALSDLTLGNADAIKHGLARKLSGIATNVLRGDGTWADVPAAGVSASGLMPALSGVRTDRLGGDGVWTQPNPAAGGLFYATDFLNLNAYTLDQWAGGSIGTGGADVSGIGTADHPGVMIFKSGTATGAGYYCTLNGSPSSLLLAGRETSVFVFRVDVTTGTTAYLGFLDTISATAPVDGVWIDIAGAVLSGKAKNNAGPTTTDSTYTITQGVWYRGEIVLNAAATLATFALYTCSNGALVWTGTVAGNIPTTTGRETNHGVVVTSTATSSVNTLTMDYMNIAINRVLMR